MKTDEIVKGMSPREAQLTKEEAARLDVDAILAGCDVSTSALTLLGVINDRVLPAAMPKGQAAGMATSKLTELLRGLGIDLSEFGKSAGLAGIALIRQHVLPKVTEKFGNAAALFVSFVLDKLEAKLRAAGVTA
jgi:hypothetical protein